MSTIQPIEKTTHKHCENCGREIYLNRFEISRYRIICFGRISFRYGRKYIMRSCEPCINEVVSLFITKKHNVVITLLV
jgi:hypothetical protein